VITRIAEQNTIEIDDLKIVDIHSADEEERRKRFAKLLYWKRQRKGMTHEEALDRVRDPNYFGVLMVESGEVDGFLAGFSTKYANTIRPALQVVGTDNSLNHIAGMYIVLTKTGPFFFADTTVNINPNARTLADITMMVANEVRKFNIEPHIAMLSYSNFGSNREESPTKVGEAVAILHREAPDLIVDGEFQANYAFNRRLRQEKFPFTKLSDHDVNTVIFPDLSSGNIAYKMMQELGGAEVIGPVVMGLAKPIQVLQMASSVREIVNMAAITVIDAGR